MALKDWKKVAKTQWLRKNYKDPENPYLVEVAEFSRLGQKGAESSYVVRVWTMTEDLEHHKKFKNETQAIKYAKEYMRKN